jgi:hypothetical protein
MTDEIYAAGLHDFEQLVQHEYGMTLLELLKEPNISKREKQLWRLTGVMLKQSFAYPVPRKPTSTTGARYRWDIDPVLLAKRITDDSWEARALKGFSGRRQKESVMDYALRLKSETNFGRAFKQTLCLYICCDPATQRLVEKALRDAGLGTFAKLAKPRRLMAAGCLAFAGAIPLLSVANAGLIAAAMFIVATLGLKPFCDELKLPNRQPLEAKRSKSIRAKAPSGGAR